MVLRKSLREREFLLVGHIYFFFDLQMIYRGTVIIFFFFSTKSIKKRKIYAILSKKKEKEESYQLL